MKTPNKTTNHSNLRRLVDARAKVGMKRAQQAATYSTWFREQVQASIDDPRPSVDDNEVRRQFAAKREAIGRQATAASKARH
jgi:hypothetical protein